MSSGLGEFTIPGSGIKVVVTRGNHPEEPPGQSVGHSSFWLEIGGKFFKLPVRSQHKARELVLDMIEIADLEDGEDYRVR